MMERTIQRFETFEEADQADRDHWASLTPEQRIEALESIRRDAWKVTGERLGRLPRVVRVLEQTRG
jgi:hypothetical protein